MTQKLLAFLRRGIQEQISYRAFFLRDIFGTLFSCLTFFFLSRIVAAGTMPALAPYRGNYFAFALVGIAFSTFQGWALTSFSFTISSAQHLGTMEILFSTPTPPSIILLGSSLFPLLRGVFDVLLYFLIGILILGVRLPSANLPAAAGIFFLSLVVFIGLGLLASAWTITFKKGDPFVLLIGVPSAVVSGIVYPVSILPVWLQKLAPWFPLTHSLEGIRRALLSGASLTDVSRQVGVLAIFAGFAMPAGILSFRGAIHHARRNGTLTQF